MTGKFTDVADKVTRNSIRLHDILRLLDALDVGKEVGVLPEERRDLMEQVQHIIQHVGAAGAVAIPPGETQ